MRYAKIENWKITNIVEADADFAAEHGLTSLPQGAGIGWTSSNQGATWQPPVEPIEVVNRRTIEEQARQALLDNAAFLAVASPSNAQNATQIKALTRQNNKIIRLLLGDYSGTD